MLAEFVRLKSLRLDRGWTYRQLAAEVNKISPTQISVSSLHALLTDAALVPNELTLHGVRKFLESDKKRTKRGKRPKQGAAA